MNDREPRDNYPKARHQPRVVHQLSVVIRESDRLDLQFFDDGSVHWEPATKTGVSDGK